MKITVFTPTYNRAYILEQLYRSLQRQTCHDFEWLIVDDGSTDATESLVRGWMTEENPFLIRYIKQENGGKHCAINTGLDLATGELFFTVDSDDYLTDDAIEKILIWENELPKDRNYCGFAGTLGTAPNKTSYRLFEGGYFDGTALDRYGIVDGERAFVFYTEIHKKYRYPIFEGEKFMTEAVAWNRMAHDGYQIRFYNDIIWIYKYRADGLTMSGFRLFLDNPRGYGLVLREKAIFQEKTPTQFLRIWYTFTCDLSHRYSSREIASFIGAPYGVILMIYWMHRLMNRIKSRG